MDSITIKQWVIKNMNISKLIIDYYGFDYYKTVGYQKYECIKINKSDYYKFD
jgi:hypothetical protein